MNIERISTASDPSMYVVLFPHSITNPTDTYRVTTARAWLSAYSDGRPLNEATDYPTFEAASARVAELNAYASLMPVATS